MFHHFTDVRTEFYRLFAGEGLTHGCLFVREITIDANNKA